MDQMLRQQPTGLMTPSASSWRDALPVLSGMRVTLREIRMSDALPLLHVMQTPEVSRFLATPPASEEAFQAFIQWVQRERTRGRYACFAVFVDGSDVPVGLFQIRQTEPGFVTGEWGFALSQQYWGEGIFAEAARLVIAFAFSVIGVHRLEARAAVANARCNGALRKIGAIHEGVLRSSFRKDGRRIDQSLWSLLADEWDAPQGRDHSVH
jgi:ribosomal-protein-alanine N-acetyltransferase